MDSDDELNGWDPMKEAYEQRHFNSYKEPAYDTAFTEKHNPVRGTRISPAKGAEDEVTLFVSNIPISLTEDAMKNMFSSCGRCRRVKKCRPKISNSDTTFGFIAFSSVREAEEAITKFDGFPFGKDNELRVRLSHGKERNFGFVPQSIDIKLGSSASENDDPKDAPKIPKDELESKVPVQQDQEFLFPNMFQNDGKSKQINRREDVKRGPRLYIQGISVDITAHKLEEIIGEIAPCRDGVVVSPRMKKQFTTYGFVTVGSLEDADKVIEHFTDFGRMKVSFSEQSAKDYGRSSKTDEDDFYLKLYEQDNGLEEMLDPSPENDFVDSALKFQEPVRNFQESQPLEKIETISIKQEQVADVKPQKKEMAKDMAPKFQGIRGLEVLQKALNGLSKQESLDDTDVSDTRQVTLSNSSEIKSFEDPFEDLSINETILPKISKHSYAPITLPKKQLTTTVISTNLSTAASNTIPIVTAPKEQQQSLITPAPKEQQQSLITPAPKEQQTLITPVPPEITKSNVTAPISSSTLCKEEESIVLPTILIQSTTKTTESNEPTHIDVSNAVPQNNEPTHSGNSNNQFVFTTSSIPNDIPLEFAMQNIELQSLYSDSYEMHITRIDSPYLMYGVLNHHEHFESELRKLPTNMVNFYGNPDRQLKMKFKAGMLAAVQVHGKWSRSIVTNITDDSVRVFLIDDGMETVCERQNMRPLVSQFRKIPAQAIPLKLFNVKPLVDGSEWPSDTTEFLKNTLLQKTVIVNPEFKDKTVIAVKMNIDDKPVHELLQENNLAHRFCSDLPQVAKHWIPGGKDQMVYNNVSDAIEIEKPTSQFDGYITCAPSPKLFFCRLMDNDKDIKVDEIENNLKEEFENEPCIPENRIFPGELCSLKTSKNHWHRGFIMKLLHDTVMVFLIDYGSKCPVPKSCIYPLPEDYQEFPAQAIKAQLQYVTPLRYNTYSAEAIERFDELVAERPLFFRVINTNGNLHRVLIFDKETGLDVGKTLVDEGYGKFIFDKPNQPTDNESSSLCGARVSNNNINQQPDVSQEEKIFAEEIRSEVSPPRGVLQQHSPNEKSSPRGILQRENSPTNLQATKVTGRGLIMGRGLALLKERGLLPS